MVKLQKLSSLRQSGHDILAPERSDGITKPLEKYRQLDLDDLLIITLAFEGVKNVGIAKILNLSQAAISQRKSKMNRSLGSDVFTNHFAKSIFTPYGWQVARTVSKAVYALYGKERQTIKDIAIPAKQKKKKPVVKEKKLDLDDFYGEATECGFLGPDV